MRKTVGDPHQRKLQARCTAKIQKSVAFSAGIYVCVCVPIVPLFLVCLGCTHCIRGGESWLNVSFHLNGGSRR